MSGFVYLWRDRKNNRYYLGSHWGSLNDGYICSSSWMKAAYHRRPKDFKRRILKTITSSRKELLIEEERWLKLIANDTKKKSRYYNLSYASHYHWTGNVEKRQKVGTNISSSKQKRAQERLEKTGSRLTEAQQKADHGSHNIGRKHTDEWKAAQSKRSNKLREEGILHGGWHHTEEHRRRNSEKLKGRQPSEATKEGARRAFSKTWKVTTPAGIELIVTNLKAWAKEHNLADTNMKKPCGSKGFKAIAA